MKHDEQRRRRIAGAEAMIAASDRIVKESPDITVLPIQLQVMIHMVALAQVISKLPEDQRTGAVAASNDGLACIVERICGERVMQ